MNNITHALNAVWDRIAAAERRFGRMPGSTRLLAVSKAMPVEAVREAAAAGQIAFGENYLQEAMAKQDALVNLELEWHFIGPVQSNKTRAIARRFDWIHSIDRLKIAKRLSEQRGDDLSPLNVCVQVNLSGEATKSGVSLKELAPLACSVAELPRLRLRGLMAVPRPVEGFAAQCAPFGMLRKALGELNAQGLRLDTLSMGMTQDMEAAIAEGATIVRIGTAIFGSRRRPK